MKNRKASSGTSIGLIVFALVLLINPTVRVVDIFPDFIACFIIVKQLAYAAYRAPFFEEARDAFKKIAYLSILKLPAFIIISYAKGENVQDHDTAVLFTLVFSVIETILFYKAISSLFRGIFYLGQRSSAASLISPFEVGRIFRHSMTPESLRTMSYVFIAVRSALCALPEMLLLTRSVDPGIYVQTFRPMKLYPYAIVLSVFAVLVLGIITARRITAYVRAVAREGVFVSALDSLIDEKRALEINNRVKSDSIKFMLGTFTVASCLTLELCFDNFDGANILPHFIYASVLFIGILIMRKHTRVSIPTYVLSALYIVSSAVTYFKQIWFIDEYGYSSLIKGKIPKEEYLPVIICAIIEFLLLAALTAFMVAAMRRLAVEHTAISPDSERYTDVDREYHKAKMRGAALWGVFAVIAGATKLADVALRYYSDLTLVSVDNGIGNVVSGLIPWFNLVLLAGSALYIGYSIYFFGTLKEDVEQKYS